MHNQNHCFYKIRGRLYKIHFFNNQCNRFETTKTTQQVETSVVSILAVRSNRNKQILNPHHKSCKSSFDFTLVSFNSKKCQTCCFETTHCQSWHPSFFNIVDTFFPNPHGWFSKQHDTLSILFIFIQSNMVWFWIHIVLFQNSVCGLHPIHPFLFHSLDFCTCLHNQ